MNSKTEELNKLSFEVKDLRLVLGDKKILDNLNMAFNGPGIILIEGENGSGKSSFLKVMAGFTYASSGDVLIPRENFSYLTTSSLGLLNDFTGYEHIKMIDALLGCDKKTLNNSMNDLKSLEIFQEILDKKVSDMSQGMKQILRLFLHLYYKPQIIFLDEPFLYLSPKIKDFFQKWVEKMGNESLIFITDQSFSWTPNVRSLKIRLGEK